MRDKLKEKVIKEKIENKYGGILEFVEEIQDNSVKIVYNGISLKAKWSNKMVSELMERHSVNMLSYVYEVIEKDIIYQLDLIHFTSKQ